MQKGLSIIAVKPVDFKLTGFSRSRLFKPRFVYYDRNSRLLLYFCQKIICGQAFFLQNTLVRSTNESHFISRFLNIEFVVFNRHAEFREGQFKRLFRHVGFENNKASNCQEGKQHELHKPKRQQEVARVGEVTVKQLFGDVGQREALFLHGAIVDLDGIDKLSRASGGVDPYLLFALQVNYGHTGAFRNTDDIPHGKGLSAAQEAMYREGISGVFNPPEAEDEEQPCRDRQKHKCQNERDAGRSPNNADQTSGGCSKKRRDREGQCVIYGALPLAVGDQGNDGPDAQGDPKDKECCYFDAPPVVWP